MVKWHEIKPLLLFHLLVNVVFVLFITGASYFHTPLTGWKDSMIYLVHLALLQTTVAGIIYFLSLYPRLFRIFFSLMFLSMSCFSFWAYTQDVSVTPALIQAIFETKPDIAADVITLPYVLFFLGAVAALFFILKFYKNIQPRREMRLLWIPALACVVLFFVVESNRRGSLKNRLPYNIFYAIKTYTEKPSLQLNTEIYNAATETDSIKMVLVLGETVRADHLQFNGYDRNTTPWLSKRSGLVSFPNLYTKYSYTGASVPQILTDQLLFDTDRPLTSIYSVANKAGYFTSWIGNQTLEKSFNPIAQTNHSVELVDAFKSEFSFAKALDEELLPPFKERLSQGSKQLITLHMIGSHWWYENRYTEEFRQFTPVIDSKYVPSQSAAQMINSYDNTLLYLDYFLEEIIRALEKEQQPTVMLYVADHGEHLGEGGKWLHAQAGEEAKKPAYIIWLSEAYQQQFPEKLEALQKSRMERKTTDEIFPTVLDLLTIDYAIKKPH